MILICEFNEIINWLVLQFCFLVIQADCTDTRGMHRFTSWCQDGHPVCIA